MLDLLAVETMGEDAFQFYRIAVVASGVLLVALAAWGIGAAAPARVLTAAIGAVLLGYGVYLFFFIHEGLNEVYPFLFILPALAIGYLLYSRVEMKEVDASVRKQLEAERGQRRAARAAQAAPTLPTSAADAPAADEAPGEQKA